MEGQENSKVPVEVDINSSVSSCCLRNKLTTDSHPSERLLCPCFRKKRLLRQNADLSTPGHLSVVLEGFIV